MSLAILKPCLLALAFASSPASAGRIAVIGVGEIRARPDQADLSIRIEATRPKVRDAMAAAQQSVRAVFTLCLGAGRDSNDVGAGQVSVDKEFRWVNNSSVFRGWQATQQVTLRLRDLDRLGALVEALSEVKGARIEAINYLHGKRDSLERIAEAQALGHARLSALGLATELGRTLGEAVAVRNFPPAGDNDAGSSQDFVAKARGAVGRGGEGFLVKPDQIVVQALVSAEFELGPGRKP